MRLRCGAFIGIEIGHLSMRGNFAMTSVTYVTPVKILNLLVFDLEQLYKKMIKTKVCGCHDFGHTPEPI